MNKEQKLFLDDEFEETKINDTPVTCLGMEFPNDNARREYFREELRKKLPELKSIEGFPIGEDDDIINLSDPPYYTACPNPWINDIVNEWQHEKVTLEKKGERKTSFEVKIPYTDGIKEGKNSTIYNAHTYHTKVPYQIIMRYILHYTQPGDIVLDGFAGTGMTGVASTACGNPDIETKSRIENDFTNAKLAKPKWGVRHSICGDLSPLCYHISSNYNHHPDTKELENVVEEIISELKEKFHSLYEFELSDGNKAHINYFVWSEIVSCSSCGNEMNVHDLSFDYNTNTLHSKLKCPKCGREQDKRETESIFESVFDESINETVDVKKYRQSLFNYTSKGRGFSKNTLQGMNLDKDILASMPKDKFPETGNNIPQLFTVGCRYVSQVYPKRTQFILSYLYNLINHKFPKDRKELMFIFTSMLPKLTRMNRYMPQHGSRALVGPMANVLYIPPIYVENNPIDQFEYQAKKVLKAFSSCLNGNGIQVCSATQSSLKNNSIDYIFTDPPFGANIMYSELNFIAESWLKLRTNNKEEAISNKSQNKGLFEYQYIMTECLKEYYRILKPGHWMTVEFSNTSASFWNCLQYSIQNAGFVISAVTDLNKERGGLFAMIGPTAVKQDLAISCYKPSQKLSEKFDNSDNKSVNAMDFIEDLLMHLPVHITDNTATSAIVERHQKILYDNPLAELN